MQLHIQDAVRGTVCCSLCVLDRTAAVLSHKKRKKRDTKAIQSELHSILQVSLHLSGTPGDYYSYIAADIWICSQYNNELFYDN